MNFEQAIQLLDDLASRAQASRESHMRFIQAVQTIVETHAQQAAQIEALTNKQNITPHRDMESES